MRILITGILGSLASQIVKELEHHSDSLCIDGVDVNIFSSTNIITKNISGRIKTLHLESYTALTDEQLSKYDEVIHCAGLPDSHTHSDRKFIMLNKYDHPVEFIRKCLRSGVQRFTLIAPPKTKSEQSSESESAMLYNKAYKLFETEIDELLLDRQKELLRIRIPNLCGYTPVPRIDTVVNEYIYNRVLGIPQELPKSDFFCSSYNQVAKAIIEILVGRETGGDFDLTSKAIEINSEQIDQMLKAQNDATEPHERDIILAMKEYERFLLCLPAQYLLFPGAMHRKWHLDSLCSSLAINLEEQILNQRVEIDIENHINKALLEISEGNLMRAQGLLREIGAEPFIPIDLFHTFALTWLAQDRVKPAKLALHEELRLFPENTEAKLLLNDLES